MRYMQIKSGQRLHLVYEAGEGRTPQTLIPAGMVGVPICGQPLNNIKYEDGYRL